jgi:uncharacterized protein (TIGR02186 family)
VIWARALLALWLMLTPAMAQEAVVAGLSSDEISITANFNGSEILIFGAVQRETPPPVELGPLQVIITIEGPDMPITVRRKGWWYGIWINSTAAEIDAAPTFYAVSTTSTLAASLTDTQDLRHRISIPRAIRSVGTEVADQRSFTEALMRIRTEQNLYQLNEGAVTLRNETLFDTSIQMPANLVEGDYATRIFLTRGREVVGQYSADIRVRKVGLERWIYNLAHAYPLIYGILSLTIAIIAGWLASAVFRYIRLS